VNVLTPQEAQTMASLGFDVVRLGIIWKGLEPGTASMDDKAICSAGTPRPAGPNQFDAAVFDAYLDKLDATIALLGHYGISSIIDMHQDVYSDVFGGEGAPNWAVCTGGAKPKPELDVPDWSVNLQGPGVVTAYEHFWDNDVVGNLQGKFDSMWARVASHFRDNPWVIGYDPFNEPYGQGLPPAGSGAGFDAQLECFYAGRATPGSTQAGQPVQCPPDDPETGLIPRIEDADPDHLVFYEGNYTTDSGPLNHIGPMPYGRLVLNFHDYCFLHVPNGPEPPDFGALCGPLEENVFVEHAKQRTQDASAEQPGGIPSFLTEFGATTDAGDLSRIAADADANLVGWTYWQWLLYDDPTGSHTSGLWPPSAPTPPMLQVLSRTYPTAIAGTPTAMSFDPGSGRFSLSYRNDPRIAEPTVVFVPVAMHYPDGYCAAVSSGRVSSAPGAPYLDVEGSDTASVVTVTVTGGDCGTTGPGPARP
jgi:endoglycosylceramidase